MVIRKGPPARVPWTRVPFTPGRGAGLLAPGFTRVTGLGGRGSAYSAPTADADARIPKALDAILDPTIALAPELLAGSNGAGAPKSLILPEALNPQKQVFQKGIRTYDDYQRAVRLIRQLPSLVTGESRAEAEALVAIVDAFEAVAAIRHRQYGSSSSPSQKVIEEPVLTAKDRKSGSRVLVVIESITTPADQRAATSYCRRTASEQINRDEAYAHEVYLEYGANIFWLIHEMLHALPTDTVPAIFRQIEIPVPSPFNSGLISLYKDLVGAYARDEARSVLGEALLYRVLMAAGARNFVGRSLGYIARAHQEYTSGLTSYLEAGTYLGENHLVIYQLRSLFQVADALHKNPGLARDIVLSDNIKASGLQSKSGYPFVRDFLLQLLQQYKRWLATKPKSGDPLIPIRNRVLQYLGAAAPVTRARDGILEDLESITIGSRPTPPPGSDPTRLQRQPDISRDRILLVGQFAEFLQRLFDFSAVEVQANLRSFLRYAEWCNPEVAGLIYARLLMVYQEQERELTLLDGVEIAHSLLRSGYVNEGRAVLEKALTTHDPILQWDTDWNEILLDLHRMGLHAEVAALLDRVEAGRRVLHAEYEAKVMQAFNRQGWWRRGGQAMVRGLVKHHAFGLSSAMLYDLVKAVRYHRGRGKSYYRFKGYEYASRITVGGKRLTVMRKVGLEALDTQGSLGADRVARYYRGREIALLHALYEISQEYQESLRQMPNALLYLGQEVQRDPLAVADEALPYLDPHIEQWQAAVRDAKDYAFRWFKRTTGVVRPKPPKRGVVDPSGQATMSHYIYEVHRSYGHRNIPQIELQVKGRAVAAGNFDDLETAILGDQGVFLQAMLNIPGRFRLALRAVRRLPDSQVKVWLFALAAKVAPAAFSGRDWSTLFSDWERTIDHVAVTLPRWRYIESGQRRSRYQRDPTAALPPDHRHSYFYQVHRRLLSEAMLRREDAATRAEGIAMLVDLPVTPAAHYNVYNHQGDQVPRLYRPTGTIAVQHASTVGAATAQLAIVDDARAYGNDARARDAARAAAEILVSQQSVAGPDVGFVVARFIEATVATMDQLARLGHTEPLQRLFDRARGLFENAIQDLRSRESTEREWQSSRDDLYAATEAHDALYLALDREGPVAVHYRAEVDPWEEAVDTQRARLQRAERVLLSQGRLAVALGAMAQDPDAGRRALHEILDQLHHDVEERNQFYPVDVLIAAAGMIAQNDTVRDEAARAYRVAIRALSLSRGQDDAFERNAWSVAASIDRAPFSGDAGAEVKDTLMVELVDALFPESRMELWVSESAFAVATGEGREVGIFDYVLRDERYPEAERSLLRKAVNIRDLLRFNTAVEPETRAKQLYIMRELFLQIAAKGELFLERERLLGLAQTSEPEILRAINAIFLDYAVDTARQISGYPTFEALQKGDYNAKTVQRQLREDVDEVFAQDSPDLARLTDLMAVAKILLEREVESLALATFEALKYSPTFMLCYDRVSEGMRESRHVLTPAQDLILAMMMTVANVEEAQLRLNLFRAIFRDATIRPEIRRRAFEGLYMAEAISPYVHDAYMSRSESTFYVGEEAAWFARLVRWESLIGRMDDFSLSLFLESPDVEAQRRVERMVHLQNTRGNIETVAHPYRLSQPEDLEYYLYRHVLTNEERAFARNIVAVGEQGHVREFRQQWRQAAAEFAFFLAMRVAADLTEVEATLIDLLPDTEAGVMRLLAHFEKMESQIAEREAEAQSQAQQINHEREAHRSLDASLKVGRQKEREPLYDVSVIRAVVEEQANAAFPDVAGLRLVEFFTFLEQYDIQVDSLEDLLVRAADGATLVLQLAGRWLDHEVGEYVGAAITTYRRLIELFEENDPVEWRDVSRRRVGRLFKVGQRDLRGVEVLRRLDGLRSSIAVDGDPEVALQAFVARARQWEQERLARRDRIEMAELPIPEILEDRAPLMQFIGTRYYLELPIGERRGLMRELEADPDRAMLRFFELTGLHKVGQFLSNWPEVPDTIQAELAELQDNVAPSNWEDVEGTIVRIFGDAHGQWIVDHIVPDPETGNRCHKAGTIGEVYLVRDESGTMHVLKVIPQTKYDKVERALERLEAVKGRMASHPSIEGSPTAIRIIDRIMTTIRRELDLTRDIHNAAEFRAQLAALPPALRERLIVPTFDLEHQHPQGILMSFEAGHRVDDVTAVSAEDAHAACALLHELLLRAMMQHTWIPEDLHPGNFFVRRRSAAPGDVNVVILDFGRMVQTLEWERARVRSFIETLFHGRDNEAWLQAVERMGKITLQYEPTDLGHRITEIQHEAAMTSVDSVFAVVQQLLFAAGRFGLEVRGTYLELIKAMSSFNGTTARIAQVHGVPTAWAMNATMTFLQIVQELKDNARTMREEERVRNRNLSHQEASATVRRILMDYGVRELEKYAETINRLVQLFRREAGSMTLMATYLTRLGIVPEDREACIEDIRDEIG